MLNMKHVTGGWVSNGRLWVTRYLFFSIVFFLAILTISIKRDVRLGVFSWLVVSGGGGGG